MFKAVRAFVDALAPGDAQAGEGPSFPAAVVQEYWMMVAFGDVVDDSAREAVSACVAVGRWRAFEPAVRPEKISAACEAIERRRYELDDTCLDIAIEGIHRTFIGLA